MFVCLVGANLLRQRGKQASKQEWKRVLFYAFCVFCNLHSSHSNWRWSRKQMRSFCFFSFLFMQAYSYAPFLGLLLQPHYNVNDASCRRIGPLERPWRLQRSLMQLWHQTSCIEHNCNLQRRHQQLTKRIMQTLVAAISSVNSPTKMRQRSEHLQSSPTLVFIWT